MSSQTVATFGAAKAILAAGLQQPGCVMVFRPQTGAGNLSVLSSVDNGDLELSLESLPPTPEAGLDGLVAALGVDESQVLYTGRNRYDILVELDSPSLVESLTPDQNRLNAIETRGFIVTALGSVDRAPAGMLCLNRTKSSSIRVFLI